MQALPPFRFVFTICAVSGSATLTAPSHASHVVVTSLASTSTRTRPTVLMLYIQ